LEKKGKSPELRQREKKNGIFCPFASNKGREERQRSPFKGEEKEEVSGKRLKKGLISETSFVREKEKKKTIVMKRGKRGR